MQLEQDMKAEPQYRIEIEANDNLLKELLERGEIIELRQADTTSTLAQELKKREARLAIPLVSRGELVGLLSLGERLSGQKYGPYDQNLLIMLSGQAAPALRIAQLVMEQQAQALENERIEQELRTARFIQQALLPKGVPELYGWQIATYYQPAREVGGDFYDFHLMADGRTSILIGDVTGKGIPAALFMTTTCTMLRSVAKEISTPGEILAHVNELLYSNIPEGMFVTCFYAILDPGSGELCYANAGHDLPYRNCKGQADEVLATGMPLGLMPGMRYEEKVVTITQGETLLFYSDGLVEAHNPRREIFGLPRLARLMTESREHAVLIDELLESLKSFTREGWEQEDDVTLVTLHRIAFAQAEQEQAGMSKSAQETGDEELVKLAEWSLASVVGNERPVMERIGEIVRPLKLEAEKLANLETAVAEAVMNAMEHGNHYQEEKRVTIQVFMTGRAIIVRIHDEGTEQLPATGSSPDLAAKLAGQQTPRGWGLFLIENLVDELHSKPEPPGYIELIMYRQAE
jgi:serine phosphatase RsbU (regulator of sigma subunit)/anti-sigma regulatory factor (Ser/Thr protein kinase)